MNAQQTKTEPVGDEARFGTFQGVYRPIVLTVLGALLYLREGWLVGNAGLGGALLVIAAAYTITGTTALSLSSIATNLRVRAGGAFAIISAALGLEAGGAIGVPLYIAQAISSVMYLYAFTEGWGYIFPSHDPRLVVVVAFALVAALTLRSAQLAFKAQAVMLFGVAIALGSAFSGWATAEPHTPQLVGRFPDADLLTCFALFFPAATGIMVGAGMSGSLENPRRSIPRGTMAAWATTLAAYTLGAIWYATVAPPEELLGNKLTMVDHALVGELVLLGLLSSTLMAALSSLVAAPRLVQAMAEHGVVPFSSWLQRTSATGEPRNATLLTLGIAGLGLLSGSLDAIAPIITSFFVMTYLALNVVVFLEQQLGMVSWRPTFRVPSWVPALGAVACVLGLVLSSPAGGLPEVAFVTGIYIWLTRFRHLQTSWETVHSGIAVTVASWAALKASQFERSERSWKPDLLMPVADPDEAATLLPLAAATIAFRGSVKLVALREDPELVDVLERGVLRLRTAECFASWHALPEESPGQGARLSINAMKGTFFAPNLLVISARHSTSELVQQQVDHARALEVGTMLYLDEPTRPFPTCGTVNVWLSDRSPDWELSLHVANLDLPVLLAYLLTREREGAVRLITVVRDEASREAATRFLNDVIELGRLPNTTPHVLVGGLRDHLGQALPADAHLFGLPHTIDLDGLQKLRELAGAPCLFVEDSGHESALA